jgi:hypothetical protein
LGGKDLRFRSWLWWRLGIMFLHTLINLESS